MLTRPTYGQAPSECGRAGDFVQLYFVGNAWPPSRLLAVEHELSIELGRRRALQVCVGPEPSRPPSGVVTLFSKDLDRVSIVPFRLEDEGSFSGRTIDLTAIPEDARPLAVAQAVDEVLLGEIARVQRPRATKPSRTERRASVAAAPPPVSLSLATGLALAFAPNAATGAERAAVAPGLAFRFGASASRWGTSIGVTVAEGSHLAFGSRVIEQRRAPFDLSLGWVALRSPSSFETVLSAGLVLALSRSQLSPDGPTRQRVEAGGRLAVTAAYGKQLVTWFSGSFELLSARSEIRFEPTGPIGTTSNVWLGLSAGLAWRWPS